ALSSFPTRRSSDLNHDETRSVEGIFGHGRGYSVQQVRRRNSRCGTESFSRDDWSHKIRRAIRPEYKIRGHSVWRRRTREEIDSGRFWLGPRRLPRGIRSNQPQIHSEPGPLRGKIYGHWLLSEVGAAIRSFRERGF